MTHEFGDKSISSQDRSEGWEEVPSSHHARPASKNASRKEETITQEEVRRIFQYDAETGMMVWKEPNARCVKAGDAAGNLTPQGYRCVMILGRGYMVHRIAWLYTFGKFPIDCIDHINGVKDDNRLCNLREATPLQNCGNRRVPSRNNTSGFLGAFYDKQRCKWTAKIRVNGKLKALGRFKTPEEAHQRYLEAKRQFHEYCTI